jgi:hypothetical protein
LTAVIVFVNYLLVASSHEEREGNDVTSFTVDIRMPRIRVKEDDEYICIPWVVPEDDLYIIKYEALQDKSTVHHMILNGCPKLTYNDTYRRECYGSCAQAEIIFAWGLNAPATYLPKDVGFHIGRKTKYKVLSLQVHYLSPTPADSPPDEAGLRITLTRERQPYTAGIFLLVAGTLTIPAHAPKVTVDVTCKYYGETLHIFAFRTHSHSLGRVISGYMIHDGQWHRIGKGNPQWPQAFYPADKEWTLQKNDFLAARCTYNATEMNIDTNIGAMHTDEMCNFYIMYYSEKPPFYHACNDNRAPELIKDFPADADTSVSPNPTLDMAGMIEHMRNKMDHSMNHTANMSEVNMTSVEPESLQVVVVEGWPAGQLTFGQISGVATDSTGNVHIFHRGYRIWDERSFDADHIFKQKADGPIKERTIIELNNATGNIVHEWGDHLFFMPHGLHIDRNDAVWVTDVALHQVMRFEKGGGSTPSLVLGAQFKPGSDQYHFCKPSDVATLDSGEFFVSDGYCNERILKFSKEGKFILQSGQPNDGYQVGGVPPGDGQLNVPHSLTVMRDQVCVADRENVRIQCFTLNGTFSFHIYSDAFKPRLFAINYNSITDYLYTVAGPSHPGAGVHTQGAVIDPETSAVITTFQPKDMGFIYAHDIAVSTWSVCLCRRDWS